ncbi:hypothetical protein Tco_0910996 [Tanacetum coccineum]|uniref:Uncharacterized protein n=1 Tax=Tanacetum coccineum TaxID=301880 RepID=A0ABQ5CXQ2_9ASTR
MADKKTKSIMKDFTTNDHEDYYSGITCITVNGKNAYELKGKFLNDLHNNAFDGNNREDAFVELGDGLIRLKKTIDSWVDLTAKFFGKYYPPSSTGKTNTQMIRWDPTNPKFENWLASKFVSYKTMDISTKGALWDYWKIGSDKIEPTDDESSDLDETDHDDEQEISEIFRIETNLFNYETPLCEEFKEFNYLLKIDPDLLTKDIEGFKTYEEFKDDWIYEWNKDVLWVDEKPWTDTGDYEWYEALRNKAIMEGLIDDDNDDESRYERKKRWNVYDNTYHDHEHEMDHKADEIEELCETHEPPVCNMRRFKMIKYSFTQDEGYVAIKEDEYDDLARTSDDACRAYQEIFRMMDE